MTVAILDGPPARPARFGFTVSALAELGAALHRLTAVDHRSSSWSARIWSHLPEALRDECRLFSPMWGGYRSRLLLPISSSGGDMSLELARLAATPLDTMVELSASALAGGGRHPARESYESWLRRRARSRGCGLAADLLLGNAAEFRSRLAATLEDCWRTFFSAEWRRLAPRIELDMTRARRIAHTSGLLTTLTRLVPGSRIAPAPDRLIVEKLHHAVIDLARTELLVIPSVLGAPHVLVKHEPHHPAVVQYPVPSIAQQRAPVPVTVLSNRLRVLSNPVQLQVCRMIARHPRSTQEMAETLGMSSPEMSRHLRVLRDSGMVVTERRGRFVLYTLRYDELASLGSDMLDLLLR